VVLVAAPVPAGVLVLTIVAGAEYEAEYGGLTTVPVGAVGVTTYVEVHG
jgi:hypothetical protein